MGGTNGVRFICAGCVLASTFHHPHGHKLPQEEGMYGSPHFSRVSTYGHFREALGRYLSASLLSDVSSSRKYLSQSGILLSGVFWSLIIVEGICLL